MSSEIASEFGSEEANIISDNADEAMTHGEQLEPPPWHDIPQEEDNIKISLSSVNVTLDPSSFAQAVGDRAAQSKFAMTFLLMIRR